MRRPSRQLPPATSTRAQRAILTPSHEAPVWFDVTELARLERLALAHRRGAGRTGEFRSRKRGGQLEFLDHRPYSVGDDLKFLDWAVYGRLDQLHVKTFARESAYTVTVVVDGSPSMNFSLDSAPPVRRAAKNGADHRAPQTKFEAALFAGVVVSYLAMTHGPMRPGGNRVTFVVGDTADGKPRLLPPRSDRAGFLALLRDLREISTPAGAGFPSVLDRVAGWPIADGVMVVVTDGYDPAACQAPLKRVAARPGLDVVVIHLLSAAELAPDLDGAACLVDSETGAEVSVQTAETLASAYRDAVGQFIEGWREFCAQHGIFFVSLNAGSALLDHLLTGLFRAGVVG